jgi:metallophosphoesterase (TIGR03768 family)
MCILPLCGICYVDAVPIELPEYPIADEVYSTIQRKIVPDAVSPSGSIYPYQIDQFEANGYGSWHYEAGTDYGRRLDLMPEGYDSSSFTNSARLLRFFTISDVHITDEESPVQAIFAGYMGGGPSAYSPVIMLTTQVLDATVRTIDAVHAREPFDFGLAVGDAINGAQYNELRWYLDIIDGKNITPDSGAKDDPVSGPGNDYQDAFKAAGLSADIRLFQTIGNHDFHWLGTFAVTDYLRPFYTGRDILLLGNVFVEGMDTRSAYMGSLDGSTPLGNPIGCGPVADFPDGPPQVAEADENRRPLSSSEWMDEFFTTASQPSGHGFSSANIADDNACYTFDPVSDIPIRVIVLSDIQPVDGYDLNVQGYLSGERFDWLVGELERGQAEGKLMIVCAHIPIFLIGYGTSTPPVSSAALLAKLSVYPNLILWISGHLHRNLATPHPSINPYFTGEEYGFWEVETPSLRDFPQEFRTFDIERNSDNSISIFIRNIDPAVADGSLAAKSREYAVAMHQYYAYPTNPLTTGPYNAELVKQLSPEMQTVVASCGQPLFGAKWSDSWGWVDDTYHPWVYDYSGDAWFYMYSGRLDSGVDDCYWVYYVDFSGENYGWGYVYPGKGWWRFPSGGEVYWMNANPSEGL